MPRFSIITPTLQRESLIECCASVDSQTLNDQWEHIVMIDATKPDLHLIAQISHPQRKVLCCGVRHNNYGNTPRRMAWAISRGDYCCFLDDDNELASPQTLSQIAKALKNNPDFAIFPILRHGQLFFNDPPGLCLTDTLNVIVKREFAQWPAIDDYVADGIWVEALKAAYSYEAFPNALPIGIMEKSSLGV